jgi:3-hydroxyacyl-[acyl-carrier-protein] dehydratase
LSLSVPQEVLELLRIAEKRRLHPAGAVTPILDRAGIEALVPHRGLALLLDRVTALDPAAGAVVARYDLLRAEPLLAGHFPGYPVWPGTSQVEAIGQAGCVWALATAPKREAGAGLEGILAGILGARFLKPVRPPADVEIVARVMEDGLFRFVVGQCLVDGEVCSAAALCAV